MDPDLLAEARHEVAVAAGELVPTFVEVPDGFYTHTLELDGPLTATVNPSLTAAPCVRRELPTPIPRTRTVMRWEPVR